MPETRNAPPRRLRLDNEATQNDTLFFRGSYQHRDPQSIRSRRGNALTNLPHPGHATSTRPRRSAGGRRSSPRGSSTSSAPATTTTTRGGKAPSRPREVAAQLGIETTPEPRPTCEGSRSFKFTGAQPAREHQRSAAQRRPDAPTERLLDQRQLHVDHGRPFAEGRRPLDPQHGSRRLRDWAERPRAVHVQRRKDRQRVHRFSSRPAAAVAGQHQQPRDRSTATRTTSPSSCRTTGRSAAA